MHSRAEGPAVLEFAEQPFPDPRRELGIDVADRPPGRLVELDRADDRVAEEQCAVAPGRDDDAEVAGGVPALVFGGTLWRVAG